MKLMSYFAAIGLVALATPFVLRSQSPPPQSTRGEVCPLSEKQQVAAAKAFDAMVPTFQTPRCINCHGAVDPYDGTNHVGGSQNDTTCASCHTISPGEWETAPSAMFFTDETPVQLCRQMKENLPDASSFISHITEDRGGTPFIQTAFLGTRALNLKGQQTYQTKTGKKYGQEPPPISHTTFIDQGEKWIEAMGGSFRGDSDCGCVPHQYVLSIDMQSKQQGASSLQIQTSGHSDIPLQFQDDGSFVGHGQMTVSLSQSFSSQGGRLVITCTTQGTMVLAYQLSGSMDDKAHVLHTTINSGVISGSTSSSCSDGRNFSHTIPASGLHPGQSVDIPAYIGVVSEVPQSHQNPGEFASSVKVRLDRVD